MAIRRQSLFLRKVERNKRIRRLRRMFNTGAYAVDSGKMLRELETLHATRKFRSYELKAVLQSAQRLLMDASLQNSAYRSRAVEIKMTCFKVDALLEEHLKSATSYLLTKFADILRQEHTTIKGREDAVRYVLEDFHSLRHRLRTVMTMADLLISDLDSTAWSIKGTVDVMQMAFQKERNI
jgi:hypothetical protein